MTQLIAESGSTKTSWKLLDGEKLLWSGRTLGMNPYFTDSIELSKQVQNLSRELPTSTIDTIFFYGAGCSNLAMKKLIKEAFYTVFPELKVEVDTDLMAAARALFGSKSGIVAILGTGANCGAFDGVEFVDRVPSLGFSLGDEGSAGFFGKYLLRDFYYKRLPVQISDYMQQNFNMDINYTLTRLYKQGQGNAYVASFAAVLSHFQDHPYIHELIQQGIEAFIEFQLGYFKQWPDKNIGLVGTVGSVHERLIGSTLKNHGWNLVRVIQDPMEALLDFHIARQPS